MVAEQCTAVIFQGGSGGGSPVAVVVSSTGCSIFHHSTCSLLVPFCPGKTDFHPCGPGSWHTGACLQEPHRMQVSDSWQDGLRIPAQRHARMSCIPIVWRSWRSFRLCSPAWHMNPLGCKRFGIVTANPLQNGWWTMVVNCHGEPAGIPKNGSWRCGCTIRSVQGPRRTLSKAESGAVGGNPGRFQARLEWREAWQQALAAAVVWDASSTALLKNQNLSEHLHCGNLKYASLKAWSEAHRRLPKRNAETEEERAVGGLAKIQLPCSKGRETRCWTACQARKKFRQSRRDWSADRSSSDANFNSCTNGAMSTRVNCQRKTDLWRKSGWQNGLKTGSPVLDEARCPMTGLPSFKSFPVLQKDWAPHDLVWRSSWWRYVRICQDFVPDSSRAASTTSDCLVSNWKPAGTTGTGVATWRYSTRWGAT